MNVEGTRRMLDFAAAMRASCGALPTSAPPMWPASAQGLIREDELAVGQSYRNTYEQTKAEAEALVRSRLGSLPGVILRPSIIVGDSRTGVTSSFKMMYWPLKIYARRLWRTVPGYPDAVLDIVPVDFVATAVARLAFDESALGQHRSPLRRAARQRHHRAGRAARGGVLQGARAALCRSQNLFCRDAAAAVSGAVGAQAPRAAWTAAPTATTSPCACSSTPPMPSGCWGPRELPAAGAGLS